MKVLSGKCLKCGSVVKLAHNSGDTDVIKELLQKRDSFECPGHHMELISPYPMYWFVDTWKWADDYVPTDEEAIADLVDKGYEIRDTAGMSGLITSFCFGFPMTNDGRNWDFTALPSGKRVYFALKEK